MIGDKARRNNKDTHTPAIDWEKDTPAENCFVCIGRRTEGRLSLLFLLHTDTGYEGVVQAREPFLK